MHFFSSNSISSVIKHAHLPTEHNPQKIHHVNVLRTSYPQCSAYKTVRPAKTNTYCLVVVEWWVGALLLCTTLLKCSNVRKILTPLTAPSSALASNTDRPAAAPYLCPETQQQTFTFNCSRPGPTVNCQANQWWPRTLSLGGKHGNSLTPRLSASREWEWTTVRPRPSCLWVG